MHAKHGANSINFKFIIAAQCMPIDYGYSY